MSVLDYLVGERAGVFTYPVFDFIDSFKAMPNFPVSYQQLLNSRAVSPRRNAEDFHRQ